jgi:APA family basic amino acid/polyamine antiporter
MNLLRRKSVTELQAEALTDHSLKRALGPLNLTMLGVGAIIGTGIFVLAGLAAARNAGPAVVISFVLAGIVSTFAALCYSEFASLVPMSGSAYTYGYATLGELFAWIIGWDLALEYAVGAITVSVGWSSYVVSFLHDFGIQFPPQWIAAPGTELIDLPAALAAGLKMRPGWSAVTAGLTDQLGALGTDPATLGHATAVLNVPAILIVVIVTTMLVIGIKESARFNNFIVLLKIAVVLMFIIGAAGAINQNNWHPFIPANSGPWQFGWSGVLRGASLVFFAYIGFDAVSTAAQEAKNPQRDMPIGIIGSLLICTILYILVSGIAAGVTPYRQLDVADPIALAADQAGMGWMARFIKFGAIAGLSSVILVMMLGQTRVFWTMSRDGLLPPIIARVHSRFQTPWLITIATGVVVAFFGAVLPVADAANLCNIGTLLAFVIVSVGVLVLRVREPDLPRKFKTPFIWFVAPMGALSALGLMLVLPLMTWLRLLVWFIIGMIVYFAYGVRNSRLAQGKPETADRR